MTVTTNDVEPARRRRLVILSWSAVAVLVLPQPYHQLIRHADKLIDLQVYRNAGLSLLHHQPVYDRFTRSLARPLPFTYPPLPAFGAVPLALMPFAVAALLWEIAIYSVLVAVVAVVTRPVRAALPARWSPIGLPAAVLVAAYLLPIRDQARFGQVGLFLMALVVVDLLTSRTGRWQGVLVGLATAIKLTPGVFIPYLWLAGRRRAAIISAASAVGFSLVAAAVSPSTSRAFWFHALLNSDRLGPNADTSNQSLRGMLLHFQVPPSVTTPLFAVLVAVVGGLGLWRARTAARSGDELLAVTIVGLLSALLSPVAWIHHFVWVVLALVVLARSGRWRWCALTAAFYTFPLPWFGQHRLRVDAFGLNPVWHVLQNAYGLGAVALVLLLPVAAQGRPLAVRRPPLAELADGPREDVLSG